MYIRCFLAYLYVLGQHYSRTGIVSQTHNSLGLRLRNMLCSTENLNRDHRNRVHVMDLRESLGTPWGLTDTKSI